MLFNLAFHWSTLRKLGMYPVEVVCSAGGLKGWVRTCIMITPSTPPLHHKYIYFIYFVFGSLQYFTIYWLSCCLVWLRQKCPPCCPEWLSQVGGLGSHESQFLSL